MPTSRSTTAKRIQRFRIGAATALVALLLVSFVQVLAPAPNADAATIRLAGADRFSTNVAVSRTAPSFGGTVYLVSGAVFADALPASALAAADNGRLLLSRPDTIPAPITAEINRLRPSKIVLIGGLGALSSNVEAQARSFTSNVERIGGVDRVETSFLIFDRLRQIKPITTIWVASGKTFPDALAASSVAGREGHAVLLWTNASNDYFRQAVAARMNGVSTVYIAGGNAAIGSSTEQLFRPLGASSVRRFAGSDRFETAVLLHRALTPSTRGSAIMLASGQEFPDALSASVTAAQRGIPLYLTARNCATSNSVASEITRLRAQDTIVIGGDAAISQTAALQLQCETPTTLKTRVFNETNAQRNNAGAGALQQHEGLSRFAQNWADTIARTGNVTHNPNLNALSRSIGCTTWGENIAWTQNSQSPMSFWMGSAGHRANIVNARFTQVGIGVATASNGRTYWVMHFGACPR
ncbi:cell wall-binding repeat-containing protein [Humidisolicoccus flavus]|uniref:cell wall-binding repeat-containing protein n=1 Tax=Humidisolicoccus flavus TaxID=3111414 RepID=UPI00324DFF74